MCVPLFHAGQQPAASSKAAGRIRHVDSFSDPDEVLRETCPHDLLPSWSEWNAAHMAYESAINVMT